MMQSRCRAYSIWMVVALVISGMLVGIGSTPAVADVSGVNGGAFGYFADNISILGGVQPDTGPVPTVTLPSGGSAPVAGSAPSGLVRYGPATLFSSAAITVRTEGTTGPGGSVTSSTNVADVNTSGQEAFTATALSSTCTASESGTAGSTTVTGGTVRTSEGAPNVDGDDTLVFVPTNPVPNTTITGALETVGDTFRYVFNEQIPNSDGSITVNAAHLYLLGPTATGDLIIGQSVCGITATASTTTTTVPAATTTTSPLVTTTVPGATTTTNAGGATTTTAPGSTTTTVPGAATTTSPPATATTSPTTTAGVATTTTTGTGVAGGAYGYFVSVALLGGSPVTRGPAPSVTLPVGGSVAPVTDSASSATAQFGPAILFTSDQLEVSTQGVPGGSVTSSAKVANVNRSGQEQLTAAAVTSTCSASATQQTGSATLAGGRLTTSSGTDLNSDADDTVVVLPFDPAPNTPYEGRIEGVGDTFRVVLNEQVRSGGSITVNAVHLYLLGPTAVGELIIGQSRCGTTTTGTGSQTTGGTAAVAESARSLADTGGPAAPFIALSLFLMVGGWTVIYWIDGTQGRPRSHRRMPWCPPGVPR